MRKKPKAKEGALTLEACLSLTLFMFLILFLYSFFAIFEVQTKIHHTLLQAAQSMSLDSVATERLKGDVSDLFDIAAVIGFNSANVGPEFVSPDNWYDNENGIADAVEERFVAYLSAGDSGKADEMLKSLRVQGGLSGLDFSQCKVDKNGNIDLSVTYTVEYLFDFKGFNMDPLELTSTASSRKWE